ncbi:MAG: hypothetical protein EZS28_000550 [Streblomastix strix]|uniref:Uncharacterized protein n=1 Tax=Streblomastix strix TaxID=222440 RepID=A0A5J4XAH9_9EUKA|nr:MAG: hypothetical protein EZS28_000550 [Streblomastix strix]
MFHWGIIQGGRFFVGEGYTTMFACAICYWFSGIFVTTLAHSDRMKFRESNIDDKNDLDIDDKYVISTLLFLMCEIAVEVIIVHSLRKILLNSLILRSPKGQQGLELDDDDNHHNKDYDRDHDYNCRHNKDHADRKDNLEIGRSKQMTSIISSKDSKNGKSNNNWADEQGAQQNTIPENDLTIDYQKAINEAQRPAQMDTISTPQTKKKKNINGRKHIKGQKKSRSDLASKHNIIIIIRCGIVEMDHFLARCAILDHQKGLQTSHT